MKKKEGQFKKRGAGRRTSGRRVANGCQVLGELKSLFEIIPLCMDQMGNVDGQMGKEETRGMQQVLH